MRIRRLLVVLPTTVSFAAFGLLPAAWAASVDASLPHREEGSLLSGGRLGIGGCKLERSGGANPTLYATVTAKNTDPNNEHVYSARIVWGTSTDHYGESDWVSGLVPPLQTVKDEYANSGNVSASVSSVHDGPVGCWLENIVESS
jgi:hypothetical protein